MYCIIPYETHIFVLIRLKNETNLYIQSKNLNVTDMKTSIYLTAFCLFSLSIFLAWKKLEISDHGTSITVNENDRSYKFTASYNEEATGRVRGYINNCLKPTVIVVPGNDYMDITTVLPDKTEFYIKESSGRLKIELDKRTNSFGSYLKIKRICEGVKNLLAGNNEK